MEQSLRTIKISVIIPVYNMENSIAECLDSIQKQTLQEIEIICVNDGSTDSSLEVLEEYKKRDARMQIITTENRGSGPARNTGICTAKGEYIAFMDVDDFYPKSDVLETLYTVAVEKEADVCGGSMAMVENGKRVKVPIMKQVFRTEGYIDIHKYQWCLGYTRFLFRRQFIIDNELFFKDYRRGQDPPFMLEAMLAANKIYAIKKQTYCNRIGHKKVAWDERKLTDYILAMTDIVKMCRENNLKQLHVFIVKERVLNDTIKKNIKWSYKSSVNALKQLDKEIDYSWLKNTKSVFLQIMCYCSFRWIKNIGSFIKERKVRKH